MKNIILTASFIFVVLCFAVYHPIVFPRLNACTERENMDFHNKAIDGLRLSLDLGSQAPSLPALAELMPLLFARSDELETPLNNVRSLIEDDATDNWELARSRLLVYLDKPETSLILLEGRDDGRGYQPERGESLEANWVFSLVIPSLSDHVYWIVIPKAKTDASKAPYIYGFN